MAFKDEWVDKVNSTNGTDGDDVRAEDINAIANEIIRQGEEIENFQTYDDTELRRQISGLETSKVDKEDGKELSSNDYTDEEKEKLGNLANVATSGSYNDLLNKPVIDLGTFTHKYIESIDGTEDIIYELPQYREALNTTEPGIYMITYHEIMIFKGEEDIFGNVEDKTFESKSTAVVFVTNGLCRDGKEFVIQYRMGEGFELIGDMIIEDPDVFVPETRRYYYDSDKQKYIWTPWLNSSVESTHYKVNTIDETTYNSALYPSATAVHTYVTAKIGDIETALENIIAKYGLDGDTV